MSPELTYFDWSTTSCLKLNYRLCRTDSYLWRPPSRSRSLLPAVASICTDICSRDPNCNGAHLHPASTNIDTKIPKNIHKYYWIGASPCTDVYRRGSAPSPPCRLSDTLTKSDSHGQGNVRRWKFSSGLPVRTSHQCCTASLSSCLHLSHEVAQYLLCLRIGLVRTMARCCTCNGSLPASSQLASPDRQSQIHKCKYTNTNIHIRIHKYEYTNTRQLARLACHLLTFWNLPRCKIEKAPFCVWPACRMQSSKRRVDMNKEWRSDTEGLVPGKLLMHEILQLQGMLRSNGGRRRKRRVTLPWIMLFPGGCCNKSHVQGGSLRCRIQRLWFRRWQTWLGFTGVKRGSVGL